MARLNTHLSATPQLPVGRASTVDSLYREPTPRQSTYSVLSPTRSASDKENEEPDSREGTPRPMRKRPMADQSSARMPTPSTAVSESRKRQRTDDESVASSMHIFEDGEDSTPPDVNEDVDETGSNTTPSEDDEDEDEATKYYDPNQDPDVRRKLRANIRKNHRQMEDEREDLIQPGDNGRLVEHIHKQNYYMGKVKQTADAALDSRVMVFASELAGKKMKNALHGNTSVGLDVDKFVSRCIHFMKTNGDPVTANQRTSTQPGRRGTSHTQVEDDEDEEDSGEPLNWSFLGTEAALPNNKRPPAPGFLLGPLSLQRRVRTTQSRRARSQRQPLGPATRPQELTQRDIQQSENSNLTHLVQGIRARMRDHINKKSEQAEAELEELEDPSEEDFKAALRRHRVAQTPDQEAAVSLFDFVVNPKSFGQTVENLFYISFLIREGNVQVLMDDEGLPLLVPAEKRTIEEQRKKNIQKHQAVFSLDWPTWKKLIQAFDIKEPLIPHRVPEETNVGTGGWYG
ncbi:Nse4-domain-containing protein [Sporormia fimetaria CBS 119925]|uniref:Non-structural maintenance of chromosomes element 4 n=1 Tax=Sporormia fimetaria CBS 119925 TaxID=1340428 RepID=A0A6A6UX48_9PLEO|nr:Nse4-domain-containing protein [Sporormia fimetaria CBS 119925]